MAASTNHPCFTQPQNKSEKLWRYIDFTKFVSMLSSSGLFLSRADLLGDPFEGSYSKANIKFRPTVYKDIPKDKLELLLKNSSLASKAFVKWTYINCWHKNDTESAAMWKLYAKSNDAVAIQTTYSKLVNALPKKTFIGLVNYIDYDNDWLPEGNIFYPFMHKRKSFSHENEVRIVSMEFPKDEGKINLSKTNPRDGIKIKVNLNKMIEKIYVAPTAPDWYYKLVNQITIKFNLHIEIRYSKLDENPVY
jgi:hypothetical protein